MKRYFFQLLIIFLFLPASGISASLSLPGDSADDDQILINGRLWNYKYGGIKGHPFLYSDRFLTGSVTISNKTYNGLQIRYDIFTDEIMIPIKKGILQLNKELTDSFSFLWNNHILQFIRIPEGSSFPFSGYVQNIYSGKSALYIKYQKKIDRPGMANMPDNFYQNQRMYFIRNGTAFTVKNKKDFLRILIAEKKQITAFLRENKLHISRKNPGSYIPVLEYLDRISM